MNMAEAYSYTEEQIDLSLQKRIDQRVEEILQYVYPADKILELGCGKGLLAARLNQKVHAEIHGIDISSSGVLLAKKLGIKAIKADLNRTLPYKNNTFDVIFSDQLLEHIYDTDNLINEMYRILKPGGVAVTITPNLSFWLNRILFLFGFYPIFLEVSNKTKTYGTLFLKHVIKEFQSVGHIHVFNKASLTDIFRSNGFKIIDIKGLPLSWKMMQPLQLFYDLIDSACSRFPSIARDLVIVVKKP